MKGLILLVVFSALFSCSNNESNPIINNDSSSSILTNSSTFSSSSNGVGQSSSLGSSSSQVVSSSSDDLGSPTSTTPITPNPVYGTLVTATYTYATVVIGTQTWMAENSREPAYVGHLWTYAAVLDQNGKYYDFDAAQTACPEGWHLPSIDEWNVLLGAVGGTSVAGKALKSTDLWPSFAGLNTYGFDARPAGSYYGNAMNNLTCNVSFWSSNSDPNEATYGYYLSMNCADDLAMLYSYRKGDGKSVRCLMD